MRRETWPRWPVTARPPAHSLAQLITVARGNGKATAAGDLRSAIMRRGRAGSAHAPVLGVTGTGGAGKSSLTDELIRRFRLDYADELQHRGDLAVDPSPPQDRRRVAGRSHPHERDIAMVGRPESLHAQRLPRARPRQRDQPGRCSTDAIAACKVRRRRPGHRGNLGHRPRRRGHRAARRPVALCDDPRVRRGEPAREDRHARLRRRSIAINKFDRKRRGRRAARCRQAGAAQSRGLVRRSRPSSMPVFGTMASRFNDDGVTALYQALTQRLASPAMSLRGGAACRPRWCTRFTARTRQPIVPPARACATWPRSPTPCAATSASAARTGPARARGPAAAGQRLRMLQPRNATEKTPRPATPCCALAECPRGPALDAEARKLLAHVA